MKKKQLTRSILLALAMSAALGTTGMAMAPITDTATVVDEDDDIRVENTNSTEASIKIENKNAAVTLETGNGKDIYLVSAGSGIRTQGSAAGSISLESANDNQITFDTTTSSKGNGIDANSAMDISLTAANDNIITSEASEGDGVNAGKNNTGKITLMAGRSNVIRVVSDGIYTESGSTNDEEYIAENGNNEITAGNNGIDHRGSGTINLEAWNGQNKIITTAGDGIRVAGTGRVTASAKENHIEAGDNGIQVGKGGQVSLSAETNYIKGVNNGVYVSGEDSTASMKGDNTIIVDDANAGAPVDTSGIHVSDGGRYVIEKTDGDNTKIDVTGKSKYVYGILAEKSSTVDIETGDFAVTATRNPELKGGIDPRAIYSEQSDIEIKADGTVTIKAVGTNNSEEIANTNGVYVETNDKKAKTYSDSNAEISGASIEIHSNASGSSSSTAFGLQVKSNSDAAKAKLSLSAANTDGILIESETTGSAYGVNAAGNAEAVLTAKNGTITVKAAGGTGPVSDGIYVNSIDIAASEKEVCSEVRLEGAATEISGSYDGINAGYGKSYVDVTATQADNQIKGGKIGIRSENGADVQVTAKQGNNSITTLNEETVGDYGIYATNTTGGSMTSSQFTNGKFAKTVLEGKNNSIAGFNRGIYEYANSDVQLHAEENNVIGAKNYGIYSTFTSKTELLAGQGNYIDAGEVDDAFGSAYAVYAFDNGGFTGTTVLLSANGRNQLRGAVYASGIDTTVSLVGSKAADGSVESSQYNYVGSSASIAGAGDLNTDEGFVGKSVISALYAEDRAEISVSGAQNVFRTYADNMNEDQLERVLWAYNGADIDVDGETFISTDRYSTSPNSADIAIAAGSAVGLDEATVNAPVTDRATVTLNYDGNSSITGDILAAYAGQVDIAAKAGSGAGISVTGNILSGNNGILNLDLGNGGTLTGRADDYGDAGIVDDSGHGTEFFNPAFSSSIYKGGEVNLTMGEGSRWNVTGQSWITRINTETAASAGSVFAAENPVEALQHMATIDLTSEFSDLEKGGHALTVYDMKGDAAFNMKLHADRSVSDMLYMKHAEGNYIINVVDAVTRDDMYANNFDGLRFATVGAGSNANFRAVTVGQGVFNVEYEVGKDNYEGNKENSAYNGESLTEKKPGNSMVDNFFGSEGTPGVDETGNEGIQTMALYAEETPDETVSNDASEPEGPTNYKLIGRADEQTSNAGQTIIDMSKVNYSNAVYMDRLNKRMGEARYIEGDDGLWVRLRHDRIGKDDAFRSMNTMFELGYDWHAKGQKDGEHRQGVAFDYMRGTADYKNVAGDGDVRRAGVWLYDTWMGDKGHYSDYVVKYGRLSNDFDIYSELGEKISGDYDNDVWSVSAEYGRKKDIGNDWYFEPQAQMQYAYVTSADYTTSQGTKVELDGIDSLIGRAGFRLGRDTSEGNTVYFKADILHEFLGDQSIRAMDATGTLSTTYENEGTWYDVGFGFAHKMGKDSYVFLDVEHSFGNDNDDTYQINIGLNHAF